MEKIERDTLISADENRKMFDRIANTYDVANRFISLGLDQGWRKKTIQELNYAQRNAFSNKHLTHPTKRKE